MVTTLNNLQAGGDIGPDYDLGIMTDAEIAEESYHNELGEPITEADTDGCRWFSDGNLFGDYDDTQDDCRKEKDENYGPVEKDELPF